MALAITSMLFFQHAIAKSTTEITEPSVAFDLAVKDVKRRLGQIKPNMRLSYVRTKTEPGSTDEVAKFTPAGEIGGSWSIIAPEGRNAKDWEDNTLLLLQNYDLTKATLKAETDETWIFEMPALLEREIKSGDMDRDEAEDIAKVLRSELEVTKDQPHFRSSQVYSTSSFSINLFIKVLQLNKKNTFSEAWAGGPIVIKKQIEKVEGRVGLFVDLDKNSTYTNSEFKLIDVSNSSPN